MKIKNYTSEVSPERNIMAIETLLVRAGAGAISKFYEGGRCAGFLFQLPVDGMPTTFKLPSNPKFVEDALMAEIV